MPCSPIRRPTSPRFCTLGFRLSINSVTFRRRSLSGRHPIQKFAKSSSKKRLIFPVTRRLLFTADVVHGKTVPIFVLHFEPCRNSDSWTSGYCYSQRICRRIGQQKGIRLRRLMWKNEISVRERTHGVT